MDQNTRRKLAGGVFATVLFIEAGVGLAGTAAADVGEALHFQLKEAHVGAEWADFHDGELCENAPEDRPYGWQLLIPDYLANPTAEPDIEAMTVTFEDAGEVTDGELAQQGKAWYVYTETADVLQGAVGFADPAPDEILELNLGSTCGPETGEGGGETTEGGSADGGGAGGNGNVGNGGDVGNGGNGNVPNGGNANAGNGGGNNGNGGGNTGNGGGNSGAGGDTGNGGGNSGAGGGNSGAGGGDTGTGGGSTGTGGGSTGTGGGNVPGLAAEDSDGGAGGGTGGNTGGNTGGQDEGGPGAGGSGPDSTVTAPSPTGPAQGSSDPGSPSPVEAPSAASDPAGTSAPSATAISTDNEVLGQQVYRRLPETGSDPVQLAVFGGLTLLSGLALRRCSKVVAPR